MNLEPKMTKLTDTQLIVLSSACRNERAGTRPDAAHPRHYQQLRHFGDLDRASQQVLPKARERCVEAPLRPRHKDRMLMRVPIRALGPHDLSLALLDPKLVQIAIRGSLPRGFGTKRQTDLPMLWSPMPRFPTLCRRERCQSRLKCDGEGPAGAHPAWAHADHGKPGQMLETQISAPETLWQNGHETLRDHQNHGTETDIKGTSH